jgi:hypothetical protein
MTPLVKTATGDSELASTLNRVRQNIEERTILDGENYKVSRTSKGFRLHIAPTKSTETTSDTIVAAPLNMVFRGEHSFALNYNAGDVVTVQGGDSGGAFLATGPVPAGTTSQEPGVGDAWARLSSFSFGQWT